MAPTREELMAFLRQAKEENPQLTKHELAARALAHFAQQRKSAVKETIETKEIVLPAGSPNVMTPDEQQELVQSETEAEPQAAAAPKYRMVLTSILGLKKRLVLLLFAVFCLVLAGVGLFAAQFTTVPAKEDLLEEAAKVQASLPAEIGDVLYFGKRITNNQSYYDKKYRNQVLEVVGLVEYVERTAEGYLQATLVLHDYKNSVSRVQFRFLPEQTEAIGLARGTMAVLKGRYVGQKDKVMQFYPAAIVFNGAQSSN